MVYNFFLFKSIEVVNFSIELNFLVLFYVEIVK